MQEQQMVFHIFLHPVQQFFLIIAGILVLCFFVLLVHDHETSLYHFGTGHGECNVHIIRYLKKNSEDSGNEWSGEMITLLCGMNRARKHSIAGGMGAFPEEVILEYEEKYRELIARGREENKKTKHTVQRHHCRIRHHYPVV